MKQRAELLATRASGVVDHKTHAHDVTHEGSGMAQDVITGG